MVSVTFHIIHCNMTFNHARVTVALELLVNLSVKWP